MARDTFQHVTTWVFDLDNTLYPPEMGLFDQIEARMVAWVMRQLDLTRVEADRLRCDYWRRYGTTLAGLIEEHGIDPHDYLAMVHDIDFSSILPDAALAETLAALPGRRIVFTNADTVYAARVLEQRGLTGVFNAVYGVDSTGFLPKPRRAAFERLIALDGLDATRAAMFEDDARNLAVPFDLGMRTVHVSTHPVTARHVEHHTVDLGAFLAGLMRG